MATTTMTEIDTSSEFYPEPFPSGLPVIELARISLAKLLDGDEDEAALLFEVCKDKGFCYLDLRTHEKGINLAKQAEQMHQAAKKFFSAPIEEKRKFKTRPPETGLLDTGYRETGVDADGNPNKMEMVNIAQSGFFTAESKTYTLPPFLAPYSSLFRNILISANEIHNVVLSILEKQLLIPPGTFTSIHQLSQPSGDFVRVLNYPTPKDGLPLPDPPTPPHRDAVSVALLFTWQGGLQITNAPNEYKRLDTELESEESWFYVPPLPGHVIMNLGDVMHIMTNGLLNSGKHRVVTPPGKQGGHQRLSVLLVARPWEESLMRTVESPLVRRGEYLDRVVTAREWGREKVLRIIGLADRARGG